MAALAVLSPPPAEVIVVVDGDDPAITPPPGFRRLGQPRAGPAAARNRGSRSARGDVLLFVDADVEVPPATVGKVTTYLTDHPDVAGLIGSYDDSPGEDNFLSQYKNLVHHFVHQRAERDGWTFWGACGAIRREVFTDLEGFRETYVVPCIEDVELGYRLRDARAAVHVVPDLQVKHLKHWSTTSLLHSDVFCRALPWSALIMRTGRMRNDLNTTRVNRVQVGLVNGALVAVAVGARWSPARRVAAGALAAATVLDLPLLRFLARARGVRFAALVVPWQLLYHGYSGVCFALAAARQLLMGAGVLPRRHGPGSPRKLRETLVHRPGLWPGEFRRTLADRLLREPSTSESAVDNRHLH